MVLQCSPSKSEHHCESAAIFSSIAVSPSVFFVAFKGAFARSVDDQDGDFGWNLNLCLQLLCFSAPLYQSIRLYGFAYTFYRRCSLPTIRAYRRALTFWPHPVASVVSFPPPPYALGGNIDACCRLVFIVVCEARVLYFLPALFLLLGVLIFPRRSSLRICPSQWGIPATTTVMTRSDVVNHWLPHWRSREGSPAHLGRFCLTSFSSCSDRTCPHQGPTVLEPRSRAPANRYVPLEPLFFSLSRCTCPNGSTVQRPPSWHCSLGDIFPLLANFFLICFSACFVPKIQRNRPPSWLLAARPDRAVHWPSPLLRPPEYSRLCGSTCQTWVLRFQPELGFTLHSMHRPFRVNPLSCFSASPLFFRAKVFASCT